MASLGLKSTRGNVVPRILGYLSTVFLGSWPGLPFAWRRGSWLGLAIGVTFAALLNLLLLSRLIWTDFLSADLLRWVVGALSTVWVAAVVTAIRYWPRPLEAFLRSPQQDLFPAALVEYLQGNWFEAERTCRQLLDYEPRDAEARLLLASTYRASGRGAEAAAELDLLCQSTTSARWSQEIAAERQRLAELNATPAPDAVAEPVADDSRIKELKHAA